MDETISFSILEIEKTKDKQVIQDAYRRLLVKVNPEDDPEGFKRLREAYEKRHGKGAWSRLRTWSP